MSYIQYMEELAHDPESFHLESLRLGNEDPYMYEAECEHGVLFNFKTEVGYETCSECEERLRAEHEAEWASVDVPF